MKLTITMSDQAEMQLRKAIVEPLIRFNERQIGYPNDYKPLVLLLSSSDTDEIIGGLWGETHFGQLHIDLLFVPETARGGGVGRELVRQAEEEAARRGCRGVWLNTFSFQARGFYESLGYAVFGIIDDYPPGHSCFSLKKALTAAFQSGGEAR